MPRVLNKRTDVIPPDAVYVGRPSKWGNPWRIGRDLTREAAIAHYRSWIEHDRGYQRVALRLQRFLPDLSELQGKDLVCWCAPLPCHADVLLEFANRERVSYEEQS